MLRILDLITKYGQIIALKGTSLYVSEREIVTIIGSNGAGKTTLLKAISGLIKPHEGEIKYEGINISQMSPFEIVGLGIIQVPEGRMLLKKMTVYENLLCGAYTRSDEDGIKNDLQKVLIDFPVLENRLKQLAGTLSGGEQQMLAIGRALMGRPKLLMLDEPSLGLAPLLVEKIFTIISDLHRVGITILLVEQNARKALKISNRGYVFEVGNLVASDTCENLINNDQIIKLYLGDLGA